MEISFQDAYPTVAKSKIKIFFNQKTADFPTVFMDGLNFFQSYWQFSRVNINMINCNAAFLMFELKYSKNIIVNNCTFGNWTFTQVQQVIIKECSNSIPEGFSISLNFNNSSGLIENIAIKNLNFSSIFEGLIIQNYSNINITNSDFVNNVVNYGLIKVLSSSTLQLSETNLQHNKARDYGGAIYLANSIVNLIKNNFSNNYAVESGGAIYAFANSSLWIAHSTFKNNHILQKDSHSIQNISKDGYGGALYFKNASVVEMYNVNFTNNSADYGGAIYFLLHSKLYAQNVNFNQNTANVGSAIYGWSCNVFFKNCLFYQNIGANNKSNTNGAAVVTFNNSLMNISGVTCENNSGYFSSCISAYEYSSVMVYNSTFGKNTGSAIYVSKSHIFVINSIFVKISAPFVGAAIYLYNSTLYASDSDFYHNKATQGGAFSLELSIATANNCKFFNNANTALQLLNNTTMSIINSIFESNLSPLVGAALTIENSSIVNVSKTSFLKNSAQTAGAVYVVAHSLLLISDSFFSENSATPEAGKIERSELNTHQSPSSLNFSSYMGGSIFSSQSSLFIGYSVFKNNTAISGGGTISSFRNSSVHIKHSQFKHNRVQNKAMGSGGALVIGENSTAKLSGVNFFENTAPEGGAIKALQFCKIIISNNTFEANTGSAIAFWDNVHSQIYNSTFANNRASYKGGGGVILNEPGCKLLVTKTVFKGNKAISSGGAFSSFGASASFHNCLFTDNFAFKGGALSATSSNVELFASNFTKNSATEGDAFSTSGNVLLIYCTMSNNTAQGNGGVGYIEENSQINITTSSFWFDSATYTGGVLWVRKSIVAITNSYIAFSWAGVDSGVIDAEFSSIINISHTTFFGNKVKGSKGGVLAAKRNTKVWILNSKMENNSAQGCGVILIDTASVLDTRNSIINDNYAEFLAGAFCITNNSLAVIMNLSFMRNTAYHAGAISVADSITYLENCSLIGNEGTLSGAITIGSSEIKLSDTVFLENKAKDIHWIYKNIHCQFGNTKFINKLHTNRCKFTHKKITIISNITNFEKNAANHFIGPFSFYNQTILEMKETQFASSKNIFILNFTSSSISIFLFEQLSYFSLKL